MWEVIAGEIDGKKWLCGNVPIRPDLNVYIDTRTGKGVDKVLKALESFIFYQARQMMLPSYSTMDLAQELNIIAISAIPHYSVDKAANLLTFLQNHIKKRIINIFKYNTEICRTATHANCRFCKFICKTCGNGHIIDERSEKILACELCQTSFESGGYKKYPVYIGTFSSDEMLTSDDGSCISMIETCSEDSMLYWGSQSITEDVLIANLSINSVINELSADIAEIIELFLGGKTVSEISTELNIPTFKVKAAIKELADNKKLAAILGKK